MGSDSGWGQGVFEFNSVRRREWVESQAAEVPRGSRILDVGAGSGPYRGFFSHCEYFAHDFGQEPGTIGNYTKLDYESDITEIPVDDASFDVVVCTEVLEHVPEPIVALREMTRILRPGGKLLLSSPLGAYLHQEPYHFYGGYTPHWYRRFLDEAGLDVVAIERNQGFFSHYGQETRRFAGFLHPRRVRGVGPLRRVLLLVLWGIMFPAAYVFPVLGAMLDRLQLEQMATIGYHVVAVKRA
jgi:SAM-dependent methyltransferase